MEIRLLGLVGATHDGQDIPLGGPKPRALLSMLALEANAPVSVDRLIDGLWGERPPATAPSSCRCSSPSCASSCRRRGGDRHARARLRAARRSRRRRRVALRAPVQRGRERRAVQEALALWRGPPLDDLADEPFAAPEIRRLEELWLRRARRRSTPRWPRAAHGGDGRARRARRATIRCASGSTRSRCSRCIAPAARPTRSRRSGDARAFLLDEVGLEPGPELRDLNDAILRQDPALDGPPAAAAHRRRARPSPRRLVAAARRRDRRRGRAGLRPAWGLGRARPDRGGRGGRDRPGEGRIVAQYASATPPTRSRRAPARCGAPTAATAPSRASTATRPVRRSTSAASRPRSPSVAARSGSPTARTGRVDQVNLATNRVVQPARRQRPRGVAVTAARSGCRRPSTVRCERLDLALGPAGAIDLPGGPAAIAAGAGAVWVAGEEDGLVTKSIPRSGAAVKPIGVGNAPSALAVGFGGVWVANRDDGTVTRIDAATDRSSPRCGSAAARRGRRRARRDLGGRRGEAPSYGSTRPRATVSRRIATGSAPSALALDGGDVWAGRRRRAPPTAVGPSVTSRARARRSRASASTRQSTTGCSGQCCRSPMTGWSATAAYRRRWQHARRRPRRQRSAAGERRPHLHVPAAPRASVLQRRAGAAHRLPRVDGTRGPPRRRRSSTASPAPSACTPRRCDLSAGIETDDAARTITIHLRRPDAEFLYKLAPASVLPANVPARCCGGMPRREPART